MSTTATHPLAADYLRRLGAAGRHLPADRLDDLCAEIENHLAEAIPPGTSDADALVVIERLGSPEEIVEAEQPRSAVPVDEGPRSWREWGAIVLLPLGGFIFGIGWIAGLILLWSSRAWTTRDKLIGTFILPGGIAAIFPIAIATGTRQKTLCFHSAAHSYCHPVGGPPASHSALLIVLAVVVVIVPILTAIYLARRAGSAAQT
jgi:hypothetical protein